MADYLQHFNLRHAPLTKGAPINFESECVLELQRCFRWSLQTPGIGLLTGDPGVGKTSALHKLCNELNTQQYEVIYHSDTDFGRVDLYRQLALDFGLDPKHGRSNVWRAIKTHVQTIAQTQHRLPVWIIDEAQNLPFDFFRDFPAFLNFAFDSKPLMTVWFVGHSSLANVIKRKIYEALCSRIQLFVKFDPITEPMIFRNMLIDAFKAAGASQTLISDSGIDLIRLSSNGKYRQAGRVIQRAMQLACEQNLSHLSDDIIKQSIEALQ